MRVSLETHITVTPVPRGIAFYTINLVDRLLKRGRNDYILSYFDKNKERNNRAYMERYFGNYSGTFHECNTVSFGELVIPDDMPVKSACYNDYTGIEADVFHFPHIHPIPVNLRGKMAVTVHDLLPVLMPERFGPIAVDAFNFGLERLKKSGATIIADSNQTKRDLLQHANFSPERVFVVPLAHDEKNCYPEKDDTVLRELGVDSPYLLYLGSVDDPRKGVIDILNAFDSISARHCNLQLVLAGEVTRENIAVHDKLKTIHSADKIVLTDYITNEQKRALLSSATVFLFPSEYEGFGLPVLEAMACGSPVITTNVSSLPEVGGDAAAYVSPRNPEQLAFEIERLLNSESLRNKYICKGFEQAGKFSWDETARMTEDVYKVAYGRG